MQKYAEVQMKRKFIHFLSCKLLKDVFERIFLQSFQPFSNAYFCKPKISGVTEPKFKKFLQGVESANV